MPDAMVVLEGQARSPGAARRFCSATLRRWGAEQYEETARLLISELVTNAVLHARTDVTVRLELGPDGLRLEVTDGSTRQPVTRNYSLEATTGRGLALLEALCGRWGVDGHGTGKTVWAELVSNRRPQPRLPDGEADLADFPDFEAPGPETGVADQGGPAILGRAA